MNLQLLGWGPDLDPLTPGVLVDVSDVYPTTEGYRQTIGENVAANFGTGVVRAFAAGSTSSSVPHTVAAIYRRGGTATTSTTCTLYEIVSPPITSTVRGTYTAGPFTTPVIFRQFDGEIYASRASSPMKRAAQGADFTAVSGAPEAELLESSKDFLVAFNTSDGFDWHCCAIGDPADWTPSLSTQCARGEFFNKVGNIKCVSRSGENLLAWTISQMFVGRYVGAPEVWQWEQISKDIGCIGPEAACETPYGTVWVDKNDIYIYDGAGVRSLDTSPVRKTIFSTLTRGEMVSFAKVAFDRKNNLVWFSFPTSTKSQYYAGTGSSQPYCYHFGTKMWAKPGISAYAFNQLPAPEYYYPATAVGAVQSPFDDLAWVTAGGVLNRFEPGGLRSGGAYVRTGYFGDAEQASMIRSVRPMFSNSDGSAGQMVAYSLNKGIGSSSGTAAQTVSLDSDYKYPFRQVGRWHQVQHLLTQDDIVSGYRVDLVPMGSR